MKTYRVYAQIQYKNPKYDAKGFPSNAPLASPDPSIHIFSCEMEELVAEIKATRLDEVIVKLEQLAKANREVQGIVIEDPGYSIVEL